MLVKERFVMNILTRKHRLNTCGQWEVTDKVFGFNP